MISTTVIYQSRKGNTKKVAEAIAEVTDAELIDIHVPSVLPQTDLLFVGMGIYAGKPDQDLLDYLELLPVNEIRGAAVFSTSCKGNDCMELAINILEHKGITVYPVHLALKGKFLFMNRKLPGVEELTRAKEFALQVQRSFNG